MSAFFITVTVIIVAYLIIMALLPAHLVQGSTRYTRVMLNRLKRQNAQYASESVAYAEVEDPIDSPLTRGFLLLPGTGLLAPALQKADEWKRLDKLVLAALLLFLFFLFVMLPLGAFALPLAFATTALVAWVYLSVRIARRRRQFVMQFPEALDAIVRSVRAGHPLHTAVTLVADNLAPPLGLEFKRVADETAYGTPLIEALARMAERIGEPDIRFFSVVLAVQNESGGNLSEVLSNLAAVIRKRKQMRDKIRALSSEGRATSWVLFSLPFIVFGAVYFFEPTHFTPLFVTNAGHWVLAIVAIMMVSGMLIVRQIINMKV